MSEKSKQKPPEEEGGEGAPLWIISFADMMSLLMAFFVMLSTFSSFGAGAASELKRVGTAALAANYGWYKVGRSAMGPKSPAAPQAESGSEKPTIENASGRNSLAESEPKDFRTHKVFLIESSNVFWSRGVSLSSQGKDFLNTLVSFLSKISSRIVISERGPGDNGELGLSRSIVVLEYLASRGVPKNSCNISAEGTMPEDNFKAERMLEITLLGEETYK